MFSESPFWVAFAALFGIALARGQATYWIARLVTEQALARTHPTVGWRATVHRWLQGEGVARGRQSLQRWGLVVIPLCYLTVGLQTLVLAAAGLLRIGWGRFTLAQIPGALAWALIYATIGFAAWEAAIAAAAGSPWGLIAIGVIVVGIGVLAVVARRRSGRRSVEAIDGVDPATGAGHAG